MPIAHRNQSDLFQTFWTSGSKDHAVISATTTVKLYTVPAGKTLRIDRVWYNNPTGLAGAAGAGYKAEVKLGTTVACTLLNTDTSAGGATLAADTPAFGTNSGTSANMVAAAATSVTVVFTKTGASANLPAGTLVIEGRFV